MWGGVGGRAGGGVGCYSGFQVTGMIEGVFWVGLNRDFLGIQSNLKIRGSARVSQSRRSANIVRPKKVQRVII